MLWLLAQQVEQSAPSQPQAASGWLIFWLILGVIFLPYIVGSALAHVLKLKQFSNRFGTILFALAATLIPVAYQLSSGKEFKDCFRLGIDLKGGTNLVYQVDRAELAKMEAAEGEAKDLDGSLNNMVGAIARRVNPSGTEEVTVRRVGADRIEVIIPGADQAYTEEMKARITKLGTLEFQILAAEENPEHREFIGKARELPNTLTDTDVVSNGLVVARWVTVAEGESVGSGGGELLRGLVREVTTKNSDNEDVTVQQALVVLTPKEDEVTGKFLTRASEQMDPTGQMVVGFRFDTTGAARFGRLTEKYRPTDAEQRYRLAVLLDGKIQTAPALNEPIYGQGQISGNFTRKEVRQLVDVLNAGALDVPLNTTPISEFTISPLLGADVQQKGVTAISISAIMVVVFMAVYYLKAGLIAVLCLLLNLVLIMGTMIFVQGTFTLPGLAGLVLTIGMAVDANVLIFERIREELNRGASVRMAVHNGFDKAFSAIIDSNITTLIVAIVLFMIGTDQVKGFAVTLFIGIVMSMFSALYFGRTVFEVLDQKRILKNLPMLSIVKSPNIDFVGKQKLALVFSAVVILGGLGTFFSRGDDNLDIDFRGGTMVTFEFENPQSQSDFRGLLEEKFDSGITIERLTIDGESQQAEAGVRWRLRTVNDNTSEVQAGVADALADLKLKKVSMSASEITPIAAASGDTDDTEATEAKPKSAFAGGLQSTLTFSSDISLVTAVENLNTAIRALPDAATRYPEPAALYRLTGTAGDGVDAEEGQVKTFNEVLLEARPEGLTEADLGTILAAVEQKMDRTPLFEEVTTFSKSVGGEMQQQAVLAMALSLAAIIIYIWLRFQRVTFGFAAVVALVHDVAVVLGSVALAASISGSGIGSLLAFNDFKINLPMIAAFLTIVGYSLNDTIVIFDRIREVRGKNPALTTDMINTSLNQTLSRTLLTSLTTFIVVAILYAFGGEGIHGFAFCLLVGVLIGTYSSVFVASPVLLWLMNRAERLPATASAQR